jgi:Fe-S cluster biogenesis protein NfuA
MTKEEIQAFIDEDINPGLEMHGGFLLVKSLDKDSKKLSVEMGGGCQGCSSSSQTLKNAIDQLLREEFPKLGVIEDVTNHQAGDNPYYD